MSSFWKKNTLYYIKSLNKLVFSYFSLLQTYFPYFVLCLVERTPHYKTSKIVGLWSLDKLDYFGIFPFYKRTFICRTGGTGDARPLCPEGAENMTLGSQVPDQCFWQQNCIRNPKMGSNNQLQTPLSNDFFKKLFLEQKNWTFCWFLNFYGNICE